MKKPVFFYDKLYKGNGISEGLARGLQVMVDGADLTQEGMGLGTIATRSQGYTYFSRGSQAVWLDSQNMVQDCTIDTVQLARRGEAVSPLFTCIAELFTLLYRPLPSFFQKAMLWAGIHMQRLLGIKSHFTPVSPRAKAQFHFKIETNRVEVCCEFHAIDEPPHELFIMNELGADFFTAGWKAGRPTEPPPGWQILEQHSLPFLYSPGKRLRFSLFNISVDQELPFNVYWGREHADNLCWAGFAIQLKPADVSIADITCRYTVIFENEDN